MKRIEKKMKSMGFGDNQSLKEMFQKRFPSLLWVMPRSVVFNAIAANLNANMAWAIENADVILHLLLKGVSKEVSGVLEDKFWKITQGNLTETQEFLMATLLVEGKMDKENLDVYFGEKSYDCIPTHDMDFYLSKKSGFIFRTVDEFFKEKASKALIHRYCILT